MKEKSPRLFLFSVLFAVACATTSMSQTSPGKSSGIGPGKAVNGESRLRIESKPEPAWPVSANSTGTCTIVLRAIFTKDGKVTNISFIEAVQEKPSGVSEKDIKKMTKRSIEAARKIRFVPAMKDGHPVSMWMQLEYNFSPDKLDKK